MTASGNFMSCTNKHHFHKNTSHFSDIILLYYYYTTNPVKSPHFLVKNTEKNKGSDGIHKIKIKNLKESINTINNVLASQVSMEESSSNYDDRDSLLNINVTISFHAAPQPALKDKDLGGLKCVGIFQLITPSTFELYFL